MKLLIRSTNWVGDAIMALPALRAVRTRFPEAEITILGRPYVAFIYKNQRVCDNMMFVDYKRDMVGEIRELNFDKALLLQNAFEAAWFAWRAGIPERIGYARDGRSLLLTKAVPVPKPGEIPAHEQYYYLELLRRAGWLDSLPHETFIGLDVPEENRQTRRAVSSFERCPTRQFANRHRSRRFVWLGKMLAARSVCGARQSSSSAISRRHYSFRHACRGACLVGHCSRACIELPIDLTGKTPIDDLPALLSQCHLFIGNDSGAMHVAAAVGLPVVAVFGPTDPFGTAPVTPRCSIVQEKPYCSPCFLRRCPTDHRCMTRVTPDAVEVAARHWISSMEVRPV